MEEQPIGRGRGRNREGGEAEEGAEKDLRGQRRSSNERGEKGGTKISDEGGAYVRGGAYEERGEGGAEPRGRGRDAAETEGKEPIEKGKRRS